jgi:hypothetical protein
MGPPTFVGRMSDYALGRQFNTLGANLDKYGITDWLSERDTSGEGAWGGFRAITDELIDTEAKENLQNPMAPTIRLTFDTRAGRRDFCKLHCRLQAGITPGSHMPFSEYSSGLRPRVTIERYTYPDLSTAGRVGTVLLRRRFEDVQNIDALTQEPVINLGTAQGLSAARPALAALIRHQLKVGPESPISSGHLAIIGEALREELLPRLPKGKRLPVQRPWGDRPHIEEGAAFFPTKTPVPFSSSSVGRMLVGQLQERAQDFTDPYKKGKRNLAKAGEDFLDIATGLGILQGVGLTARALATIIAAVGVASWGTVSSIGDRRKY